jgi:hypothetical protein
MSRSTSKRVERIPLDAIEDLRFSKHYDWPASILLSKFPLIGVDAITYCPPERDQFSYAFSKTDHPVYLVLYYSHPE